MNREDLPSLITVTRPKVAEIGVFWGHFADQYIPKLPGAEFWLIDLWAVEGNDVFYSVLGGDLEAAWKLVNEHYGHRQDVHIYRGKGSDCANETPDEFFDWVYIDAAHDYESVKQDILEWWPKVKPGGIISGHDCSPDPSHHGFDVFGVDKAVEEIFDGCEVGYTDEFYHKSWWVRKTVDVALL